MKVLLIGESWFTYSVHQKGFDVFHTAEYVEGATKFIEDLNKNGVHVDYIPAHKIEENFPENMEQLLNYDTVILSDVGANSFLLGRKTFVKSLIVPNKLEIIKDYVEQGGSLLMVGGYMSFTGIDAKARFGSSPLKDCLPVVMSDSDDRVEIPEAVYPKNLKNHNINSSLPEKIPALLGYNKFTAKLGTETLFTVGNDPLLVIGNYGKGKSAAFASDLSPHWATEEFVNWEYYPELWMNILKWLKND